MFNSKFKTKNLKFISSLIVFIFIFTTVFEGGNLAFAMQIGSGSSAGSNQSSQLTNISNSSGAIQSFQADLFTGRAQTSVPIFVPPGRKNIQPNLNLSYSSSGGNGWLGMGWSLDLGFIQRNVKNGVPGYDSDDAYVFSFQGVYSELVLVDAMNDIYRAKDEALFLKFEYDDTGNKWTVTDKSGTKHIFGGSSACRQAGGNGTFRWQISKVIDTKGNYMTVTHTTDNGHVYLDEIKYNGNETQSYPHSHRVLFILEDRDDDTFSYISGAKDEVKKRLKTIEVQVNDDPEASGTWQTARKYTLDYDYSLATGRSLLKTIEECGTNGTTCLPETEFTYRHQNQAPSFDEMIDYTNVDRVFTSADYDYISTTNSSDETLINLYDLNADGYQDRVFCDPDTEEEDWTVQFGGETGFENASTWGPIRWNAEDIGDGQRCMQDMKTVGHDRQVSDLVDMNGDGRPDRVIADDDGWEVQINTGDGFEEPVAWTTIDTDTLWGDHTKYIRARVSNTNQQYTFVDLVDMNGDGLPDRILGNENNTYWKVQFNNGSGFDSAVNWTNVDANAHGNPGDYMSYSADYATTHNVTGVALMDMNGDGLPDRVWSEAGGNDWEIQYNNGSSFEDPVDFTNLTRGLSGAMSDWLRAATDSGETTVDTMDVNGDGLPDRVMEDSNDWDIQWNQGGVSLSNMDSMGEIDEWETNGTYDSVRMGTVQPPNNIKLDSADINGDGMLDRIQAKSSNTVWKVQLHENPAPDLLKVVDNGRGGTTTITYKPSTRYNNKDTNNIEQLPFPVWTVEKVDQADGMGNTYTTNYSYEGGMFDGDAREFRGFRKVTTTDAFGTETRNWFHQDDEKRGRLETKEVWGCVVGTDGKLPSNIDLEAVPALRCNESAMTPFSKEFTTWGVTEPYSGKDAHFVHVTEQKNRIYDGDGFYNETKQAFTYDSYGNLLTTIEYGDVAVSGDERRTENTYTYNTTDHILNALSKTELYDSDTAGNKVSARAFFYDGATSIAPVGGPTDGLLTREQEWLSTECADSFPNSTAPASTCHPTTLMDYDEDNSGDNYGNVEVITDARGNETKNTYDSKYHLFLTEIKNALWTLGNDPDHKRSFTYDERIAQIKTSTDQNGVVTTTEYDALGRVTKVIQTGDNSTNPTQRFTYTDWASSTAPNQVKTEVKSSLTGGSDYLITYAYTDGLGREIQRRSPFQTGDTELDTTYQIVTGVVEFNDRGEVEKAYTPFTDTNSTSFRTATQMSLTSKKKVDYFYDALGRRTRTDYPDATHSKVTFNDFIKTTTDQRGKEKRYTNDAYGRLVKVEEFNNNKADTYTTLYEYDVLNNLTKTTDHAGNITTIAYDSLSRKTSMDDPDMGEWKYEYDGNDNLTKQTDAKDQEISFQYDALNRVTDKNLPGSETDVEYEYDAPLGAGEYYGETGYFIGRLTQVTDDSGTHEFLYDNQGRVLKDYKAVADSGGTYEFVKTYDALGRIRTLSYPDGELVEHIYNGMGDVEEIRGCTSGNVWSSCDSGDKVNYVKDVDYNASGQITQLTYGNDVVTDYTYHANTFRLTDILTKKGATTLQDLDYTFDENGNVESIDDNITDTGHSMSQDFTYDDLNRLTQAIGSGYGTQNFTYDAIGNMTKKGRYTTGTSSVDLNMTYGPLAGSESTHAGPHAVTGLTGTNLPDYCKSMPSPCEMTYDENGNMTGRGIDELIYDSENRLTEIKTYRGENGSQDFDFEEGWNTFSFTYLPQDKLITSVFSNLTFEADETEDYSQISYYDVGSDEWKHFLNDSDFNDFDTFEYGKTYEIYVTKTGGLSSFNVSGESTGADLNFTLKPGENFISPPVTSATAVTTVLSDLTYLTDYDDVRYYDASTSTWKKYSLSHFTDFEKGKGYIIDGSTGVDETFTYGVNEVKAEYTYDSSGARVKKVEDGTTTVYLGKDYDKSGSNETKSIFLGDSRIATNTFDGTDYTTEFVHSDHISSSNVITDDSGARVGYHEYDPYGTTVVVNPEVGDNADPKHKFTGQEEDADVGLYNYNARMYDPELGRFVSPDWYVQAPEDPQTLNRYAYARNNPIVFIDPTGNFIFAAIAAIVTIAVQAAAATAAAYAAAAAFVAGALSAVGITGIAGTVLSNAIVGAAIGATLSTIDAAIQGRDIGKSAAFGAIGGAVTGGIVGPGGNALGTVAEKVGMGAVLGVARVGLGSYQTYLAVKNKSYFSAAFSGLMTIHTATVVANQIQGTLADNAGSQPNANNTSQADQSFQKQLESKELPGQKNISSNNFNQQNGLQVDTSQTSADRSVSGGTERQGLSKQQIRDIIVKNMRDATDDTFNPDPDNFGGGGTLSPQFINFIRASQFGIAVIFVPYIAKLIKEEELFNNNYA